MKDFVVAAFSGGRSSAVMLHEMIARGQPPNAVVFCNTGMESQETIDFVWAVRDNIARPAGVPFHAIEFCRRPKIDDAGQRTWREVDESSISVDGEVFEEFMLLSKFMPERYARRCTFVMKVETQGRFIADTHGYRDYLTAIGFRACEPDRIARMNHRNEETEKKLAQGRIPRLGDNKHIAPLGDYGIRQDDVSRIVRRWGRWADKAKYPLARLSNCIGCFFMRGGFRGKVAVAKHYPKHADLWIKFERMSAELTQGTPGEKKTFPILPARLHARHFNGKSLPPELVKQYRAHRDFFWLQAKMMADSPGGSGASLPLDFGGGCGDGFCGTD